MSEREPLMPDQLTHGWLTQRVSALVLERRPPRSWRVGVVVCALLTLVFVIGLSHSRPGSASSG